MKSIRDLTMSKKEEKIPDYPSKPYQSSFYGGPNDDDYGAYPKTHYLDDNYSNDYCPKKYQKDKPGDYKISMIIPNEEIGPVADECDRKYDWAKADAKSIEIGYDRIEKLLGKGYDSKYTISFNTISGYGEYEVEATLTPNK